jgi:hypothetical protein
MLTTNVDNTSHFKKIIQYKGQQAFDNRELVLNVLNAQNKPVSSTEIVLFLMEEANTRASNEFEKKYTDGQISYQKKESYLHEYAKSMDLRTVQRWLRIFVTDGYVVRKANKYILSSKGKREMQFRQYAQAYGIISLNSIMDFNFPTINTPDRNLTNLVEIFGVYVVYVLLEAIRLIMDNKRGNEEHLHSSFFGDSSNFVKGKFREGQLVNTWVKDAFNPWSMLNMFLTAISNTKGDEKVTESNRRGQEFVMKERLEECEKNSSTMISGIPTGSYSNEEEPKLLPSTFDLIVKRVADIVGVQTPERNRYLHYINIRSVWPSDDSLLYEPDSKTIAGLKKILEKHYPIYLKCLRKVNEMFYQK